MPDRIPKNPIADRIIVPLDVGTEAEAIALLDRLPEVRFWKVGLELFVAAGDRALALLRERQKKVFLDLKFHDIPNTVAGACGSAAKWGIDFLTIHATCGRSALQQAQERLAAFDAPPKLLAVTLLTSLNARDLAFDLKVPIELPEYALHMAAIAKECGLAGAVCSPQEAAALRRVCSDDFLLVCPGVRPSWAEQNDQRRSMTPAEAFRAGADYLVIGRPVTAADNPPAAWQRICQEIAP